MKSLILFLSASLIAGCASVPMTPESLATKSDVWVCESGYQIGNKMLLGEAPNHDEAISQELLRRKLVTPSELQFARSNRVQMGMSECALIISMDNPNKLGNCGKINSSTGSYGVHKQYVYRGCGGGSTKYVYVENGKVTSWQF